jgi:hypothetical protein
MGETRVCRCEKDHDDNHVVLTGGIAGLRIHKSVDIYSFQAWLNQRDRERREHVPAADKVVPLIARAGQAGMVRADIGKAVGDGLDPHALDNLLASLVEFGLLTVRRETGLLVFRASGTFPSRLSGSKL